HTFHHDSVLTFTTSFERHDGKTLTQHVQVCRRQHGTTKLVVDMDAKCKILIGDPVIPAADMLGYRATYRQEAIGLLGSGRTCIGRKKSSLVADQNLTLRISLI